MVILAPFGKKHWLLQVLPPLSMFAILFATDSGPGLMFLAGFYLFPTLFSLISIIAKLVNFKQRKWFLLRPVLVIVVFVSLLFFAHWTYNMALEQAINDAKNIDFQCKQTLVCPKSPSGWQINGTRISKHVVGAWLKYPLSYHSDTRKFTIRVYQGPDIGTIISGGTNTAFSVVPYQE